MSLAIGPRLVETADELSATHADPSTNATITMTLIVTARSPGPALSATIEAATRACRFAPTEIIVACDTPWDDAPRGVGVLVTGNRSRSDKIDAARQFATGEILGFLDEGVCPTADWQMHALALMSEPRTGAVGGPQLLPPNSSFPQRAAWELLSSWFGSGPYRRRFGCEAPRSVSELSTKNLVVKKASFDAVGGIQCPTPLGEDVRFCYKLRTIAQADIIYDPRLAVHAPSARLLMPLLSHVMRSGRHRGDISRRLPEMSRSIPTQLPLLALPPAVMLAAVTVINSRVRWTSIAVVVGFYSIAGVTAFARSRDARIGVLAFLLLPVLHASYAVAYWHGYVGHRLADVKPRRAESVPLRILILNWRDMTHPWSGGAEMYMHQLGRRWAQAGCKVGWVSERYRTGRRDEVIDQIHFYRVGGHFTLYPLAALLYLARLRREYDVIVDCENGVPFFSPLFSRKPVLLVVHHVHQEVFRKELHRYFRWLALWLEGWLMPRVYRRNTVITVSASTRRDLESHGFRGANIRIVANGVELQPPSPGLERNKDPLILYLGRLKRYKSVDILIKAMPNILTKHRKAKLAIVGQGPERESLERLSWKLGLAESTRFYGYIDDQAKSDLLGVAWILACPSRFEGWGIVCLEASAQGTPVVAADVPGLRDAVRDGATGVLVPYGDSDGLATEINELLNQPDRRRGMGEAGRLWAKDHDWDRSAIAFLNEIQTVVPRSVAARLSSHVTTGRFIA